MGCLAAHFVAAPDNDHHHHCNHHFNHHHHHHHHLRQVYELVNDAGEGDAAEGVGVHGEGGQLYVRAGQGEQVR